MREFLDENIPALKTAVRIAMCIIAMQLTAWIMGALPIREFTFPWAADPSMQMDVTRFLYYVVGLTILGTAICMSQGLANLMLGTRRDLSRFLYG